MEENPCWHFSDSTRCGRPVTSLGPGSARTTAKNVVEVVNPATGEVIASALLRCLRDGTRHRRRRCGTKTWRETTVAERSRVPRRWYELLMTHQDDLGRLMTAEQGKPLAEAKGEIAYAASFVEWFAEEAGPTARSFRRPSRIVRSW